MPEEKQTAGNQHGLRCPECKKDNELYIVALVTAALLPDGVDTTNSDTEWEDDSDSWCGCGWRGSVKDLDSFTAITDAQYIAAARAQYCSDEIEIDDVPEISHGTQGAFVKGWLWVSDEDAGKDCRYSILRYRQG